VRTSAVLAAFIALLVGGAAGVSAQDAPRLAQYAAERVVLIPAQEWTGAGPARSLLDQFDARLSTYLAEGGIADGWMYPADVLRAARRNPTYVANPSALGAQPLKSDKAREGSPIAEPFSSRLRAILAFGDARLAVVPVAVRVDTAQSPMLAELRLSVLDGRQNRIVWTAILETRFTGAPSAAADSLASRVAALFVPR
jgi:hypothetical protein